jgi:hypothetical protein
MTTDKKLNLGGALREAQRADPAEVARRQARWRQLYTAALEGAAVGLCDELEDEDDELVEGAGDELPDLDAQITERAKLTARSAAVLADAALEIEIQRGLLP